MDCNRCIEDLTAYLDGELGPAESAQVQSHLKGCPSCSNELRSFQQAAEFIGSHVKELGLPLGSWNRVRDRISTPKSRGFWTLPFPMRWRTAIAAMACIAVLASGYLWHQKIERRNLNVYIAQYEKAREAHRSFRRAIANVESGLASDSIAIDNPFIEARVSLDLNPFRSEDR